MRAGAGAGEGSGDANNVSVALLELLGQVDLAGGRVLEQFEAGDLVTLADEDAGRRVKATRNGGGAGQGNATERRAERHCCCLDFFTFDMSDCKGRI